MPQGAALVVLGGNGLSLWGIHPGSPMRYDALDFLQIKALGAPATLLLMVSQVISCMTKLPIAIIRGSWNFAVSCSCQQNCLPAGSTSFDISNYLQGVYRGLGDTKMPLWGTIGCNVINVILDPLLIFGLGWGVRGAAIATVVAEVCALLQC